MRHGSPHGKHLLKAAGASSLQFLQEVSPFERHLPPVFGNRSPAAPSAQLASIEVITPPLRLGVDLRQVTVEGADRIGLCPEAEQLRMKSVSASLPSKDCPGQKSFTPEGHETHWIEVLRVNSPQTHYMISVGRPDDPVTAIDPFLLYRPVLHVLPPLVPQL